MPLLTEHVQPFLIVVATGIVYLAVLRALDLLIAGEGRREGVLGAHPGGRLARRLRLRLGGCLLLCGGSDRFGRVVPRVLHGEEGGPEQRGTEEGEEEGAGDGHCHAYRQHSRAGLDLDVCTRHR